MVESKFNYYLTDRALKLLGEVDANHDLKEQYQSIGILQIDNFADPLRLLALGETLRTELSSFYISQNSVMLPHIVKLTKGTSMLTGHKFSRVDPGFPHLGPEEQQGLAEKFTKLGLVEIGTQIGQAIEPFLSYLLERKLSYQRIYCFVYREGDYVGPHDDAHVGNRVDVQFPIPFATISGFRALKDGVWKLYYDTPGCVRILGPKVWHEVLPVLRINEQQEPLRILLGFRFL
jgi:hypothetical protein